MAISKSTHAGGLRASVTGAATGDGAGAILATGGGVAAMVGGGGASAIGGGSGGGAATTGPARGCWACLTGACTGLGFTAGMARGADWTDFGRGFVGTTTGEAGTTTAGVKLGNVGEGFTTGDTGSGAGAITTGRGALMASIMLCKVLPIRGLGGGAGAATVPAGDTPFIATPVASCASTGAPTISAATTTMAIAYVKTPPRHE